jgi:hypothetical protein
VSVLRVRPNGELIAGGSFASIGGVIALNIASWNGSTWSPLGVGVGVADPADNVRALAVLANGDVVAGGEFEVAGAGGIAVPNLARWDGTSWSNLGAPPLWLTYVETIVELPSGDLLVGGCNWSPLGSHWLIPKLLRYDGSAWTVLYEDTSPSIGFYSTLVEPAGSAVVGGNFSSVGGVYCPGIVRTTGGVAWSTFAGGIRGLVRSLCRLPNGDIVAGGSFELASDRGVKNLARWDGAAWQPLAAGTTNNVAALLRRPDGTVVAGGAFHAIAGTDAISVATWDGGAWRPFGIGTMRALALAHLTDGSLVAGGPGGVRRWNGSSWSVLGGPLGTVAALAALPNGGVLAGGSMLSTPGFASLLRWDGAAWQAVVGLGGTVTPWLYQVFALCERADHRIVAGGDFATAGGVAAGGIAIWDGIVWSTLAGGTNGRVRAIVEMPNGDLVVGGSFTVAGGVPAVNIARWNGSAWSSLGTGLDDVVTSVVALPNGDVVATGHFLHAGAVPLQRIARWDGAAWSPFGTGLDAAGMALALDVNDRLLVGGAFGFADGAASAHLATIAPTCRAALAHLGPGCPRSGGSNVLTADLPWLGAPWEARGTALPVPAVVLSVLGLGTTSLSLPAVLPQGVAGCTLHVSPDRIDLAPGAAGTASLQLVVPSSPALVAATFHVQFLPLELGAGLALTSATATNALTLTIGSY